MRKTLVLDALALDNFSSCAEKGRLSHIENLTYKDDTKIPIGILRGKIGHEICAEFYLAKIAGKNFEECVMEGLKVLEKYPDIPPEAFLTLQTSFLQYFNHYRSESVVPIAIEQGFSRVIYKDKYHLFVYEGRPDFIGYSKKDHTKKLYARDHKCETIRSPLPQFCNQFQGYSWYLNSLIFEVDYIGLQKNKDPKDKFIREIFVYSPRQIRDWVDNTIGWFFRILEHREGNRKGLKTLTSCTTKYGLCKFYDVCNASNSIARQREIDKKFKVREEPWSAWS